MHNETAQFTIR